MNAIFILTLILGTVVLALAYRLCATRERLDQALGQNDELLTALEESKLHQAALAQTARMSGLAEMALGLAHEINTPLATISLTTEVLLDEAEGLQRPQFNRNLESILSTVDRISKIVQGLKRFSESSDALPPRLTEVSQIIDDALLLCREKIKTQGIELEIIRKDQGIQVFCVPEQISQVLIHLFNNSVDAIDDQPGQARWIRVETNDQNGIFSLRISDGGKPLSTHLKEKLAQPFFTMDESMGEPGFSLSISKGLMLSHHGTLDLDSTATATTFVMTLPSFPGARRLQIVDKRLRTSRSVGSKASSLQDSYEELSSTLLEIGGASNSPPRSLIPAQTPVGERETRTGCSFRAFVRRRW